MNKIEEKYLNVKKQGIVNILRKKYKSMEEAYLKELNIITPTCIYCFNKCKFINIFLGYKKICGSAECHKKLVLDSIRKVNENNTINDIIKVKCCVCEKNEISIRKVAHDINTKHACDNEYCQQNKHKPFLRETHIIENFLVNDFSYLNLLTYDLMLKYNDTKKVKNILYKNFIKNGVENPIPILKDIRISYILTKNFKKTNYILLRDKKYYINKNIKLKNFYLEKIYGDELFKLYETYYPEYIKKCMICKKPYLYRKLFSNYHKSLNTCSLECYYKNFNFYVTKERNKKQSNTMKRLILEGKFTPKSNNSNTYKNLPLNTPTGKINFRSTWEIIFYVFYNDVKYLFYEKLRIPYVYKNENHTYIVDFIDENKKIAYEIKPNFKNEKLINKIKEKELIKWCKINNYQYKKIGNEILNHDYSDFLEMLKNKNYSLDEILCNKIKKYMV
jgi:hypothetical protein